MKAELTKYDGIVLGPGPGNPNHPADVGLMNRILAVCGEDDRGDKKGRVDIPILGICLGFQSLVLRAGHKVRRLKGSGMHGLVRKVDKNGGSLWPALLNEDTKTYESDKSEVEVTMYHSLCADIGQDSVSDAEWDKKKWDLRGVLHPLAWVYPPEEGRDKRVLVAVKHRWNPWWGIQYHPESICTNEHGGKVVQNWLEQALKYQKTSWRKIPKDRDETMLGGMPVRKSLLAQVEESKPAASDSYVPADFEEDGGYSHQCKVFKLPQRPGSSKGLGVVRDIVSIIQAKDRDMIVLASTNHSDYSRKSKSADGKSRLIGADNTVKGRYTIMALNLEKATRLDYSVGDSYATVRPPSMMVPSTQVQLAQYGGVWPYVASYLEERRVEVDTHIPFCGGFMGYQSYELGLEGISVLTNPKSSDKGPKRPDLSFAWVSHSIVIDHEMDTIYLQQLVPRSLVKFTRPWWEHTRGSALVAYLTTPKSYETLRRPGLSSEVEKKLRGSAATPLASDYEFAVRICQEHIAAGDSYELCLTSLSKLTIPIPERKPDGGFGAPGRAHDETLKSYAWHLYRQLAASQPAPFSSFIRLGTATMVSCSPERFLKWNEKGRCELRPMKGTVKKSIAPTYDEAEKLLRVEKEMAENLMIVDLVRHDLFGVCGAGNVTVKQLMKVEGYKSVWQMVSVVVGNIPGGKGNESGGAAAAMHELPHTVKGKGEGERLGYSGVDVLAASLPPGSMTGAPKKRSCELLNTIEQGRRGLYSGVVGYMDVGGRGDWSVNIRCMFRWDDESTAAEDQWYVGAGGAVTALSNPQGEREEMETKLFNTLNGFGYLGLDIPGQRDEDQTGDRNGKDKGFTMKC